MAIIKGAIKFIFGKSKIRENLQVYSPPQAIEEYNICSENKVYLFTGVKVTGGFCVTRSGFLEPSKIGNILEDTINLKNYKLSEGKLKKLLGNSRCLLNYGL